MTLASFLAQLERHSSCELRTDPIARQAYAVDASIFEITPQAVLLPRSVDDVIAVAQVATE